MSAMHQPADIESSGSRLQEVKTREFEPELVRIDVPAGARRVRPSLPPRALATRRAFDLLLAGVAFVFALLPCLVIVVLIKLTSRGAAIFEQERVGRNDEPFEILKFRTMRHGTHAEVLANESDRQAYEANSFKLPPDDPRITAIGRFLRKTSLDELPQMINVLRGDMSIVGIRPVERAELDQRPALDQVYYCSMRPGITGLWQVAGRSTVGTIDRLKLDRDYIENWSVWSDVVIIVRTPLALVQVHRTH